MQDAVIICSCSVFASQRTFSFSHVDLSSGSYPRRIHTSSEKRLICSSGTAFAIRTHPFSRNCVRCSSVSTLYSLVDIVKCELRVRVANRGRIIQRSEQVFCRPPTRLLNLNIITLGTHSDDGTSALNATEANVHLSGDSVHVARLQLYGLTCLRHMRAKGNALVTMFRIPYFSQLMELCLLFP